MDNVEWNMASPQEDEFALNIITGGLSPCMGWIFPARREHYDRYLTFRRVHSDDIVRWQAALVHFLKKLTWKYHRPLVLKSPPHTGRVRLLLAMFPDAKFIHIRRDPFAVFRSTRHMFLVNDELNRLQPRRRDDLDGWILSQYRVMYEAYFEERNLIPIGNLAEIAFEELEADPVGQVRQIYAQLALPEFAPAEPAVRRHVATFQGYRKNEFPNVAEPLRARILSEWGESFGQWKYSTRR
jgi:hypothetical protein